MKNIDMKLICVTILFMCVTQFIFAQKLAVNTFEAIDKKALQLPDSLTNTTDQIAQYVLSNFVTEEERCRAIFIWIASNIQYDVQNMFAINFYEKEEETLNKPLKTRKGICANYAALFTDICNKSGIKSYVISGYTMHEGLAAYIPHAWNAASIDGSWFLFDPTWASGHVDDDKFFRSINNDYYKVHPKIFIKSHMPFDYLWQFLNYPITNQEFYEGKLLENKNKPFFNFIDSLQLYESQTSIDQMIASANRVEKNGVKNSLVYDRLYHLKSEIEVTLFNSAIADYNTGIIFLNEFINYRNKFFKPKKNDSEIQAMIDSAAVNLKDAKNKIGQLPDWDVNRTKLTQQFLKEIDDAATEINKRQNWLHLYLSKGKFERNYMLYYGK